MNTASTETNNDAIYANIHAAAKRSEWKLRDKQMWKIFTR